MAVARWKLGVAAFAAAKLAVLLAVAGRWGYHRDEPYYVVGGRRPDWGYVDHPPLTPLLARGWHAAVGESLAGFRVLPALASTALVVIAAITARRLGGSTRAAVIAALTVAACPFLLGTGHWFQTVPFDQLIGSLAVLVWVHLLAGADVRWWVPLGAIVGLGLQNKWTMLLVAAAITIGALASPMLRRQLCGPWPWLGALIAAAIWTPNLIWQQSHDWPTLDFIRNSGSNHLEEEGRFAFLVEVTGLLMPAVLVAVVVGFVWCWRRPQWRPVSWGVGAMVLLLALQSAKGYYVGPVVALLVAAGAIAIDEWVDRSRPRLFLAVGAVAVVGLLAVPVALPVLSSKAAADSPVLDLNDELAEELGWPQLVDEVADALDDLPAGEEVDARIITRSYGEAAAIELLGPERGIPAGTAISGHNSYVTWWPDSAPEGTVVTVSFPLVLMQRYYASCEQVAVVSNPAGVDNEAAGTPILVCRGPKVPLAELREALTHAE